MADAPVGEGGAPAILLDERAQVEAALAEVTTQRVQGLGEALRAPVEYALSTAGKRIRPVLCVAAYRAARGGESPPEALYRLSCAIEIVHTYSLVHDDLPCMDDDDLRRGRPTVHTVFGSARATLAGAALLPMAVAVLVEEAAALGLAPVAAAELVTELTAAAGSQGMVGGQLMDLEGEHRDIDPVELERIHLMKTGALLTASLRIGAIAGGAGRSLLSALTGYGRALGLAFQIADDVLDVSGRSEELGKISGRDAALRKASYPSLHGLDGARELAHSKAEEARQALRDHDLADLVALAAYVVERRK